MAGTSSRSSDPQWFVEDFAVGDRITTMSRTVTETDLINYLGVSGFFEEVFINVSMAEGSVFGRRVIPGVLVLAMAEGLLALTGRLSNGLAFLGVTDLRMLSPAAVGNTIGVELEVKSTRFTAKPGRGILELFHRVTVSSEHRVVMEYHSTRMLRSRNDSTLSASQSG